MSAEPPAETELPAEIGRPAETRRYQVDARGVEGLLVGDQGTQINYFFQGTWTDGVAAAPLVSMSGTITSPYRGLNAFGERDVAFFFGREAAATEVLTRMSQCLGETGLMVVSGVSGAGKSSLLRAGVLHRLRGAGLAAAPEAASWPCLVFTPGSHPLAELAVRVATPAGADASGILAGLSADPAGFTLTARQAALARLGTGQPDGGGADGPAQRRVLVIVDQFEQLFTQCEDEAERQKFITALHAAAVPNRGQPPAAAVVLLVRADFEARLADYPLLAAAVQDRYLLTAMTERQLRMAITDPATKAGSSVDDDLVQVLLAEVRTRPGSSAVGAGAKGAGGAAIGAGVLPLLSHALDQAWRRRAGQVLTLADYERTGGIEGAVASSAQRAYDGLAPAQQAMARQVFTRLTATTSDGVDTAVRATRTDLTSGRDDGQIRDVEAALETFTAERLLTLAAGTVEISHEALLTAWPLLRDTWLADTHADRAIRSRLQVTTEEWIRASRDPSYLYSGSRLDIAVDAAARIATDVRQAPLSQDEDAFLRDSRQATRRRIRRRQGLIAALAALAVGLAVVSAAAVQSSRAAASHRDTAISRELASESEALGNANATASEVESIAAWSISPSAQAYHAMLFAAQSPQLATFTPGGGAVSSVAFSPDGKTLAVGEQDGTVRLINPVTGERIRTLKAGPSAGPVAFSPDGKTLAIGEDGIDAGDATAQLWNPATGQRTRSMSIFTDVIYSVAFSPDGKTLAIGYRNPGNSTTTAELWNPATSQPIRHLATNSASDADDESDVYSLAFSPGGATLATGSGNGAVRLWSTATGRQVRSMTNGSAAVRSVAFSPDGATLATGDDDGAVRLWSTAAGGQVRSMTNGSAAVRSVAFSPDGATLATGGAAGTAVFNPATGRQVGNPFTGIGAVSSVVFSPNGSTLAAGDADGTVRMFATEGANGTVHVLNTTADGPGDGYADTAEGVVFSPSGTIVAVGTANGTAGLWQVASGRPIRTLTSTSHGIHSVAFSPDGTILAAANQDGTAGLWAVSTGHLIRSTAASDYPMSAVAFSPDGRILATGNGDDTAGLWQAATGREIRSLTTTSEVVNSVAFSPDGQILATGNDDGTAGLWDVATGQLDGSLTTGTDSVRSVAFSPDGKVLATGDVDGTVRLWDIATGQQLEILTTGSSEPVQSVAFSPDGQTLATADGNATAELWNVSYLVDVLPRLCGRLGGSLSRAQWARYVPSGPPYRNICASAS